MSLQLLGWTGDVGACRFYRLDEPMRAMEQKFGHEFVVTNSPDPDMPLNVIGTQRLWQPETLVLWKALYADGRVGMVYDMDDDLWNVPADNPAYHYFANPVLHQGLRDHMAHAHVITASTEPLAIRLQEELADYTDASIVVVPNTIPEELLNVPRPVPGEQLTVGWTGSATHQRDWDDAIPHVNRALKRHEPKTWMLTAGYQPHGLRVDEHLGWTTSLNEHYYRLATFDIGLVPLAPSVFNRSKSHIKALELMALGVPVIASAEPAYENLINHGVDGFLVRRPHEWTTYLSALVNDADLRAVMGAEARRTAAQYTSEAYAAVWDSIYATAWREARADK